MKYEYIYKYMFFRQNIKNIEDFIWFMKDS